MIHLENAHQPSEPFNDSALSSFPDKPYEPDVYAQPIAALQAGDKNRSICNAFARAARDIGWNAVEPNPIALKTALEITFMRSEFDEKDILQTLCNAGLKAPVHAIPERHQGFWIDLHDRETPCAAFGQGAGVKPPVMNTVHNEVPEILSPSPFRGGQGLVYNLC